METNRKIESFDEIIFEDRNKEYGAFVLRRSYDKRVTSSLALALIFVLLVVGYPVIASYLGKSNKTNKIKNDATAVLTKYEKDIDVLPPPPPTEQKIDVAQQVKYLIPVVVDTVQDNQVILTVDENGLVASNTNVEVNTNAIVIIPETEGVKEVKKADPFFVVEEMPQYPGGEVELQKYLVSKVIYPAAARENNIKGKVYVRFVITSTGDVDQVQVARPVDPLLDAEAIRVVKLLPKWTPGKQQGNAVSVWYTVPINFQLADQ